MEGSQPSSLLRPISRTIRRSRSILSAPSRSHLLMTKMSPISMIPALMAWISSPKPGTRTTMEVCAVLTISTSSCPTPTVSTKIRSLPIASITFTISWVERERPPKHPRVAKERIKTPSSVAWRCIRIRSPKIAPPVKGLVGSTATMPTLFSSFRKMSTILSAMVDLPEPGGPVIPMT